MLLLYESGSRLAVHLSSGNAPKVDRRDIPLVAPDVSAASTPVCVAVNYFMPGEALELPMGLVVSALIVNWAMILIHL